MNDFTGDSKNPILEWVYPNGGEQFSDNEIINTQWSAEDDNFGDEAISIYMSNQLGGTFNSVAEDISNTEVYELQLPESEDILTFSRFKVTAVDLFGNTSEDYGNNYFAHGIQKIKNKKDKDVKLNRRVFYINKIQLLN